MSKISSDNFIEGGLFLSNVNSYFVSNFAPEKNSFPMGLEKRLFDIVSPSNSVISCRRRNSLACKMHINHTTFYNPNFQISHQVSMDWSQPNHHDICYFNTTAKNYAGQKITKIFTPPPTLEVRRVFCHCSIFFSRL